MSLHAQLSPEAQARLASQQRTSTITSLIIAILMIALIGVVLLVIAMKLRDEEAPALTPYISNSTDEEQFKIRKVMTKSLCKPSPPSTSMALLLHADTPSPIAIPVPIFDAPEPSVDLGDGNELGNGWDSGSETGPQNGSSYIPAGIKKRCSRADRLARLNSSGGTEQCEEAVIGGLRFLKKTQNKDGSWCNQRQVGMTGLALLAYLGHCETTMSEEFGETVFSAITFLVDTSMKNKGKLSSDFKDDHWCYEHAIAVYALAEAYTLCQNAFSENIPNLEEQVQASGQFLINSQHQKGGWDYAYSEDSGRGGDLSITGWHLQALKAIKYTHIPFKNLTRSAKAALEYTASLQTPEGAYGYTTPKIHSGQDGTTLAAVGALCFQIWGKSSSKEARDACRFIDDKMKFDWNTADADLYGHYYAAQCMINFGGDSWKRYNKMFRDEVLNNQRANGSFKPVGGGQKLNAVGASFTGTNRFAEHYRTCLSVLTLEVYYRYLPATGAKTK